LSCLIADFRSRRHVTLITVETAEVLQFIFSFPGPVQSDLDGVKADLDFGNFMVLNSSVTEHDDCPVIFRKYLYNITNASIHFLPDKLLIDKEIFLVRGQIPLLFPSR
jgi:hypothetical protein